MTFEDSRSTRPADAAAEFARRREQESRRMYARRPKKIADVIAQLIAKRGYGRLQGDELLASAWAAAAGEPLAAASRPGRLRRGTLEVWVDNSTIMQEFSFEKQRILAELHQRVPDAKIRGLRFRVGQIT